MREIVIESRPWQTTAITGTITTTAGNDAIVGAGTDFTNELADGDILVWDDGTGKRAMGQIENITDGTNLDFFQNVNVTVAGATPVAIKLVDQGIPFFRANNAVQRSPIITPPSASSPAVLGVNQTSLFLHTISANDGVLIKTVYVRMPFQYTMADSPIIINFNAFKSDGTLIQVLDLGAAGFFQITTENIEVPVNIYVPPPVAGLAAGERWMIGIQIDNGVDDTGDIVSATDFDVATVSQVDAPDTLNNEFLPVTIGMRILNANGLSV